MNYAENIVSITLPETSPRAALTFLHPSNLLFNPVPETAHRFVVWVKPKGDEYAKTKWVAEYSNDYLDEAEEWVKQNVVMGLWHCAITDIC